METIEVELRPETVDAFARIYWDKVNQVARSLHRQYGVVDAEDIAQGIWEKIIPRFEKDYKHMDAETLQKVFQRLGKDVLNRESLDYMYFSGSYIYTPQEVRDKLSTCGWNELDECPDVDARVDLREAYRHLPPKQQAAVLKRYGLKEPPGGMSDSEARNERRGVDSITHWLNRGLGVAPARLDDDAQRAETEEHALEGMAFRGDTWGVSRGDGGDYR